MLAPCTYEMIDFDPYQKWLRVELVLALQSDFLKMFTFGIFGRVPDLYLYLVMNYS